MTDINKIEHGLSLGKSQGEIPKIAFVFYTSITTHGSAEARQVRIYCRDNLDIVCMLPALV